MEFKFTDPASDFSDGLTVLKIYHQDFLVRGEQLLSLVGDIAKQEMDKTLANRCIDLHCHYFHANRLHHLDEEQGLFPLLANQSRLIDGMVDLLIQDHEEIEADWEPLAHMLADPEHITDTQGLQELAGAFEKRQREHLIREDEDFLPKAAALLSAAQKAQAGARMAELRHLQQ